jgi:hypothetical protein
VLGFETIGNATLICFDGRPLLVTDPWINGSAYFGSWGLSFEIPPEQMSHIRECEYVWFSHGHPDHLNGDSLPAFAGKKILLPDFVGGRIYQGLVEQGFDVAILRDGVWHRLSKNVQVMCFTDYYQDAVLLVQIGESLVLDLNDASERGWGPKVRKIARRFGDSYLLRLSGYGDADMINLFDESGERIAPFAAERFPVGRSLIPSAKNYAVRYVVPFSSFHCYRRTDSLWAEQYTTPVDCYAEGFEVPGSEVLPAFVRVDCERGRIEPLDPPPADRTPRDPAECGDDWSEPLGAEDRQALRRYFLAKERLRDHLRFVTLRVGGRDFTIDLGARRSQAGITFEAPRGSLMASVAHETFDDLLIGNFMKTTLHGISSLYPFFTPAVAKYADNGRAQSKAELRRYFAEYLRRNPKDFLLHLIESHAFDRFHALVPSDARAFALAKRAYYAVKGIPSGES